MTDLEPSAKYLDEYQSSHFGKLMTIDMFIKKFNEPFYNAVGEELQDRGLLAREKEPEEIREEIFGKPPEKIKVQIPSTYGRLYTITKVTRRGKTYEFARDSEGRFTRRLDETKRIKE